MQSGGTLVGKLKTMTWVGSSRLTLQDWFAFGVMLALPWSTSVASALILGFLLTSLPRLNWAHLRSLLALPAAWLPLALWLLALLGTLWSPAPWAERFSALGHFHKLLFIPLLLLHFSRSPNGLRVCCGFLISCLALLAYSWASMRWPALVPKNKGPGVPVKDYIFQSTSFALSACALIYLTSDWARRREPAQAAIGALLAALFIANLLYVASSRTALIATPLLLAIVGFQLLRLRGVLAVGIAAALVAGLAWATSPYLRERVGELVSNTRTFTPQAETSEADRLEFWRKSLALTLQAPVLGHGTGSIGQAFASQSYGEQGAGAKIVDNPHNQIFALSVQLGIVGVALLALMWLFHLLLFTGASWPARLGMLVVVQNVVSSLFNSHISDFTAGWIYVFGVGVLGGALLQESSACGGRKAGDDGPGPDAPPVPEALGRAG